jgi:hypothetical protein
MLSCGRGWLYDIHGVWREARLCICVRWMIDGGWDAARCCEAINRSSTRDRDAGTIHKCHISTVALWRGFLVDKGLAAHTELSQRYQLESMPRDAVLYVVHTTHDKKKGN